MQEQNSLPTLDQTWRRSSSHIFAHDSQPTVALPFHTPLDPIASSLPAQFTRLTILPSFCIRRILPATMISRRKSMATQSFESQYSV